jgi:hypothetical protein
MTKALKPLMERYMMSNEKMILITINSYKNPYSVQVHNGDYALNIKYVNPYYTMSDDEFETAYMYAKSTFLNRARALAWQYGYKDIQLDGRNGGWLKPIYQGDKTVKSSFDDFISYEEYVEQHKMNSLFELIKHDFDTLKQLLKYSESLTQFEDYLESYLQL